MTFIERMYYFNEEWNSPLTKEQLLKRGHCCNLGCSNCPYPKKNNNEKKYKIAYYGCRKEK